MTPTTGLNTTVSFILPSGDGTFQAQDIYPTGNCPKSVAIDDLNGDGAPDLVVANFSSGTVSLLLNACP